MVKLLGLMIISSILTLTFGGGRCWCNQDAMMAATHVNERRILSAIMSSYSFSSYLFIHQVHIHSIIRRPIHHGVMRKNTDE